MLSGPQTSEHKCQRDYRPQWYSNTLAWRAATRQRGGNSRQRFTQEKHIRAGRWRQHKRVYLWLPREQDNNNDNIKTHYMWKMSSFFHTSWNPHN